MRPVLSNIPSTASLLCNSFGSVKVSFSLSHIIIVACLIPYLIMKLLGLIGSSSGRIHSSTLRTWIASTL